MINRWKVVRPNEAGNVAIPFAISLILLLGVAALVIDLGHAYVVKRELQKAAEAGAMAGARALNLPATSTTKNWTNGSTTAVSAVRQNFADGSLLSDFIATSTVTNPDGTTTTIYNVEAGYYDRRWTNCIPQTDPANGHLLGYGDPAAYETYVNGLAEADKANYVPAVKVTLAKTAGGTGSGAPMSTYFASILNVSSMTMQTSAVAMLPSPTGIGVGDAFPMAMPASYVTDHWDQDPPLSFRITATAGDGNWTSFLVDANNVPTIRGLIDGGNPTNLNIGDNIWIEPGVMTNLYDYAASRIGQTMMMAVVNNACTTRTWTPITNFVAFKIEDAEGGSGKYIQGHFVKNFVLDSARGASGTGFGTTSGPKLVQ